MDRNICTKEEALEYVKKCIKNEGEKVLFLSYSMEKDTLFE